MTVAWSSSDGSAICTSGSVDDIMFKHNRANETESEKTCMFCPVRQVVVWSRLPGGGTGGEVCRL